MALDKAAASQEKRHMEFSAIVVAAGSGVRAGDGPPKQWRVLAGRPVLRWSVEALLVAGAREVVVVIRPADVHAAADALAGLQGWRAVPGGARRVDSVRNGLLAIDGERSAVLIHDAARPLVTAAHVHALLQGLDAADCAFPALPVADTLKRDVGDGVVTVSRDGLWRAQTPQAFRLEPLRRAFAALPPEEEPTDDVAVIEHAGGKIVRVQGDPRLMKLTYPEDFAMAEAMVAGSRVTRIGQGFDAHRWGPGASVWLCGVEIAHDRALIGHSDADAGLHALTDAILGAMGDGDIGDHFPPTDPQWKGASSDRFLRHAVDRLAQRGGTLVNVDLTLICEQPKVKPRRQAMRERVADILGVPVDRVSIKATTTEGMGFTGRGEGLAAQAVAVVEMPA